MEKRKGYKFPEVTIHSRVIVMAQLPQFLIYEEYDIWYLKDLLEAI